MKWKRHGLVYQVQSFGDWAHSHAIAPTPFILDEKTIRVFVTFCDKNGIGRPGYVDLSILDPKKILRVSKRPLLELGKSGSFDDNGILACSVIKDANNNLLMFYVGFEICKNIRYRLLTGLAISRDQGESFERALTTPILERSPEELFFRGGPFCIIDNNRYRLWYVAGSTWEKIDGKQCPVYDIRYLESDSPYLWNRVGEVQLTVENHEEYGFGRPSVIRLAESDYRLFYSTRMRSLAQYRLGYAKSHDGKSWYRSDETLNLSVSEKGFDSKGIMYSAPLFINSRLLLFYNGNDFGRAGFALAELESE